MILLVDYAVDELRSVRSVTQSAFERGFLSETILARLMLSIPQIKRGNEHESIETYARR